MLMVLVTFLATMAIIVTGILLKRYTGGKLKDIDGFSRIVTQNKKQGDIIDQF